MAIALWALVGCNKEPPTTHNSILYDPYVKQELMGVIDIPAECAEVKSLVPSSNQWNLTCRNSQGEDVFYERFGNGKWTRYALKKTVQYTTPTPAIDAP